MDGKTIEQMVEEAKEKHKRYNRDNNGYSGIYVQSSVPSIKRTAIAYQTAGSNWNRGAPSSSGISYFQGTRVYNGSVDLVVKHHSQYRSGTNPYDDCPGNCYNIERFMDLYSGKYELVLSNPYGEEKFEIDFEKGNVTKRQ